MRDVSRRLFSMGLLALAFPALAPVARAPLPAADPLAARFEAWSASRSFAVTEPLRG
jgi:hypothetical protein